MLWKIKIGFRVFLPIIAAILLILSYPRFNLEFLAWVALIPLFFALENKSLKRRFIVGYFFGLIFFSGILYWLANVTVPGTIVLILLLSLAPAIFSCLYIYPIPPNIYPIFYIPSIWVISEYLRTHLLTGFPWALLAYSQYLNIPVIQISDITASYGVSFVIVLINFCIYAVIRKSHNRKKYTVIGIFILIAVLFYGFFSLNQKYITQPLKVSIVQGNIPQELKWDKDYERFILDKYEFLTQLASKEGSHIIIWPETSVPVILGRDDIFERITNLADSLNTSLLVGVIREENLKYYNSAVLISGNGKILGSYDKLHLVPFGEYIPLEEHIPWFRSLIDKVIGDFEAGRDFNLFTISIENISSQEKSIVKNIRFYKFGVLICFEDIFPDLARNFVKKGALFLLNITNDAWFGNTAAPFQHVQSSVFRAIENRVPVIRSANTGVSCFINQNGIIIDSVKENEKEIFVDGYKHAEIHPILNTTIYTRFGDVFFYICLAMFIVSFIKRH